MANPKSSQRMATHDLLKERREQLYQFLKLKKTPQIIEAARDLFGKSYNPIYYYIILQCCKDKSYNVDLEAIPKACEYDCLTLYLMASREVYRNNLKAAHILFDQAQKRKPFNNKLPLFLLNYEETKLSFNCRKCYIHHAAQSNIKIIDKLSELKRLPKPRIRSISVDELKYIEDNYDPMESSPGIPITLFKRIRTEVLPNGYALNKFWIVPKDKNNDPIEIEFSARATTQKSFLLLTMAVRQNKVLEKKLLDDEIFLYPEEFEKYYKEALSRCGINVQSYLDDNGHLNFKATKEWWSPDGVKTRKIHVHRVNKKARDENIEGALLVETLNPGDKAGYMLAENLGALISPK